MLSIRIQLERKLRRFTATRGVDSEIMWQKTRDLRRNKVFA